jgi:hypothetical protein
MFLFGGRNRCVGSVRGRVSVLLATGGNKRGDGSPVKGFGVELFLAWLNNDSKHRVVQRFEIACPALP